MIVPDYGEGSFIRLAGHVGLLCFVQGRVIAYDGVEVAEGQLALGSVMAWCVAGVVND